MQGLAKDQSTGQPLSLGKLAEIGENVSEQPEQGPREGWVTSVVSITELGSSDASMSTLGTE